MGWGDYFLRVATPLSPEAGMGSLIPIRQILNTFGEKNRIKEFIPFFLLRNECAAFWIKTNWKDRMMENVKYSRELAHQAQHKLESEQTRGNYPKIDKWEIKGSARREEYENKVKEYIDNNPPPEPNGDDFDDYLLETLQEIKVIADGVNKKVRIPKMGENTPTTNQLNQGEIREERHKIKKMTLQQKVVRIEIVLKQFLKWKYNPEKINDSKPFQQIKRAHPQKFQGKTGDSLWGALLEAKRCLKVKLNKQIQRDSLHGQRKEIPMFFSNRAQLYKALTGDEARQHTYQGLKEDLQIFYDDLYREKASIRTAREAELRMKMPAGSYYKEQYEDEELMEEAPHRPTSKESPFYKIHWASLDPRKEKSTFGSANNRSPEQAARALEYAYALLRKLERDAIIVFTDGSYKDKKEKEEREL
jgi:hypothetical protein